MGVSQMMRLSSISSQDSGFTSQDTLFLRPGSPGSKAKVNTIDYISKKKKGCFLLFVKFLSSQTTHSFPNKVPEKKG